MRIKKKPETKKSTKAKKIVKGKLKPISEKQTRIEILRAISEATGLTAKQVKDIFTLTSELAKRHLMKRGSGEFSIPEIGIKITRKIRPATKKRQGRNPRTGESVMIPARPKREILKVRLLKTLKEALA